MNQDVWREQGPRVVYSVVVVATTAAALLHIALTPLIGNTAGPFITFFPAVLFAAWLGGFGPAALSTLLSALAASYYLISFDRLPDAAEGIALLIFVLIGLGIALLGRSQERALEQARRDTPARRRADELGRLLASIVESSDDAIISKDLSGVITSWNGGAQRIFEYTAHEAIGQPISVIAAPDHLDEMPNILKRIKQGERIDHFETVRRTKSGKLVNVSLTISPVRDATGRVVGASKVARNITERKQAEQERQNLLARELAARSEAERANRLKDEFLATVSHELRTPLAAVLGWAQLLNSAELDEPSRNRAVNTIEHNAQIQAKLIEDILDVSQIVSGKLRLDLRPVQLPAIIDAAIETIRPAAEAKGVRMEREIDADRCSVEGDSARLEQVVGNLLSNAVKFTPRGGRVEVRLEQGDSQVELRVSDTGEGIQTEFLPYVFDAFRQADASSSRKHGGLGLGLAIVRQLLDIHGGSVRAHSDGPGTGTTFTVLLPLSAKEAAVFPGALGRTAPALNGIRVLVVEDNSDTRQLVTALLENQGAEVTATASAPEAFQAFRLNRPDVLLSDIGMPGEDGYALLRRIRAWEAQDAAKGNVPAVAFSAYVRPEDRQQALAAGFLTHLPKPISQLHLTRAIQNAVRS